MDVKTFAELLTPLGQRALNDATELSSVATTLQCLTQLRKSYSADLAQAALTTVQLRRKAG